MVTAIKSGQKTKKVIFLKEKLDKEHRSCTEKYTYLLRVCSLFTEDVTRTTKRYAKELTRL